MGYVLNKTGLNTVFAQLAKDYIIYGPKLFVGGGRFSATDCIRYGEINSVEEIVFDKKSDYSFKEVLLPISETLFYFTEETVKETEPPKKGALVFLRSCDLQSVKRLDEIYLLNGNEDYYYKRLRDKLKFVLMGCQEAFPSCFCVDMKTNISGNYDLGINKTGGDYKIDCQWPEVEQLFAAQAKAKEEVVPAHVTTTPTRVHIPADLSHKVNSSSMWQEYDKRCINCGRCNFVCPTCTCFTMQDLYYTDNGKVGERRRVWASCMVDGYADVAGGGTYRRKNGERMRFKVLHKVLDFKNRSGFHMCVGCGRCDDICPEYISFSHCINKLGNALQEVDKNGK